MATATAIQSQAPRATTTAVRPLSRRASTSSTLPALFASTRPALRLRSGEPLNAPMRRRIESSFRADLGSVRIHRGSTAAAASDRLGAKAFAFGPNIVLGSGAHPDDLGLLAHEAAHTIQQGSVPVLQPFSLGGGDSHEQEAQRASEAVLRGERFHVRRRTGAPRVQRIGIRSALDYFANAANNIPGFALLTYVIGTNPINLRQVVHNAANLFRAVVGLLPGGNLIVQALQRHGILDRLGAWLEQQFGTLGLGLRSFCDALDRFVGSLSWSDVLDLGGVWRRARRIFSEPCDRLASFAQGLVGGILSAIRAAILRPVARLAQGTRGYDLLRLVLAQDPITGDTYPRTAENMIGGFMRLIGEEEKWRHLQEARAIPRAWAWFQGQIGTLMEFVSEIPQLFSRLWQSLQIRDLLDIGGAFNRVLGIFGGFAGRFFTWAGTAALEIMMFIFEALAPGAMPVLRRAASVIGIIVREPIRFVRNLVRAGKRGFEQFRGNIRQHLVNGLVGWLTGALSNAGLQLPTRWDARGILSLVLQVLNLTWPNIRVKLVRVMGETAVAALETTFDLVMTLVREGPAAAWQKILEHLQNLREMVFGRIRDWVTRTVVGRAVVQILSMLNPAGAVIAAIIAIYDTIIFFRDRFQQIRQVAESFFNSIAEIAAGNTGAAANRVEQTMGRFVPVVIGFLAGLIRLGGISGEIRNIITRLRAPIDRALDRVAEWIAAQARRTIVRRRPTGRDAGDMALREQVRVALMRRIGNEATIEQVQTVVQNVRQQFTSRGLRRIEISEPNAQRNREILLEASPFSAELLLELAQERDSVNLAATVRFRTSQRLELSSRPTRVQDPSTPGNVLYASARLGITIVNPTTFARPLTISRDPLHETVQSDTFQATSYNTPRHAHAEENFVRWFDRTFIGEGRSGVRELQSIVITLTHSPCRQCCHHILHDFRNTLTRYVGAGHAAPTLGLHYQRPHITGPNPTTVEDLGVLGLGTLRFQITANRSVTMTDAERDRRAADRVRPRFVRG